MKFFSLFGQISVITTKNYSLLMIRYLMVSVPVIVVAIFLASLGTGDDSDVLFQVTLADSAQYSAGVYMGEFTAPPGKYLLRFVPNGDSPQYLTITISSSAFSFTEQFKLHGTIHDTGISEYYTWEYIGNSQVDIPSEQQVRITINPHGNIMGPVSVSLQELKGAILPKP